MFSLTFIYLRLEEHMKKWEKYKKKKHLREENLEKMHDVYASFRVISISNWQVLPDKKLINSFFRNVLSTARTKLPTLRLLICQSFSPTCSSLLSFWFCPSSFWPISLLSSTICSPLLEPLDWLLSSLQLRTKGIFVFTAFYDTDFVNLFNYLVFITIYLWNSRTRSENKVCLFCQILCSLLHVTNNYMRIALLSEGSNLFRNDRAFTQN